MNLRKLTARFAQATQMPYLESDHIIIETPHTILREFKMEDAPRLHEIVSASNFKYFGLEDSSRADIDALLLKTQTMRNPNTATGLRQTIRLAITEKNSGDLVGGVEMETIPENKGICIYGMFTQQALRKKGYGREALWNMMHYGFQVRGIHSAAQSTQRQEDGIAAFGFRTDAHKHAWVISHNNFYKSVRSVLLEKNKGLHHAQPCIQNRGQHETCPHAAKKSP